MNSGSILSVNLSGILAAAIVAFAWGALYYNVLGRAWMAAQGKTEEQCKAEFAAKGSVARAAPFAISFVALLVMGWMLYGIALHVGVFAPRTGIIAGFLCWLGFVLTTVAVNNAFSGRPARLTAIDAGHWLGALVILGAVVGWFGP